MTRGQRIVVVSPHSDDGVLSVGGFMSWRARAGVTVELLTVLALDPDSGAEAGGWDSRAGFRTEGEAARARRAEDRAACSVLGVAPYWLPFGSVDYDRHGRDDEVWAAVSERVADADVVLAPGSPLTHPDHAWLNRLLVARLPSETVALYAEQPYTLREGGTRYSPVHLGVRERLAKWRAVRAYRSQLPLLALRGARRGPHVLAWTPELIDLPASAAS